MRRAVSLAAALALALAGCGGGLPLPTTGPHVKEESVPVQSEPPPGKVEIILAPPPKLKHPVWIDGEYEWNGRRWLWKDGRWEEPQPDSYYAPPTTVRLGDGTLVHFKGSWRPNKPKK